MGVSVQALFVLDPLEVLNPLADSTHVMITEALRRGHKPFAAQIEHLALRGGHAWARVVPIRLSADGGDRKRVVRDGEPVWRELASFAVVLMRKDPPVDHDYLAATWVLDHACRDSLVVNAPQGLRDLNEKLSILAFADLIPRTLLTADVQELRDFLDQLDGKMIVKPVDGFGGREVLLVRREDPNLGTILEMATRDRRRQTVAQEYVAAARGGDKRILLLDGEPMGAVLRVPAVGELRNNFHAGGTPQATALDERDRAICSRVGPYLKQRGQFFAGIDVIGGMLTEINVTSPTGMQEINRLVQAEGAQTMQARFWEALESKLGLGDRT
jgi:glutathione synthase